MGTPVLAGAPVPGERKRTDVMVQMQTTQADNVPLHVGRFMLAVVRRLSGRVREEQGVSFIVQRFVWLLFVLCVSALGFFFLFFFRVNHKLSKVL